LFIFAPKLCFLDFLIHNHNLILESTRNSLNRQLADQIDWADRMICIKGFRGVGKTTFLLNYIRNTYGSDKSALYINLNNLYFTRRRIFSFADEFSKLGGKVLFLDQINKFPGWSSELRKCYDEIPDLKFVFTASPVSKVKEENPDLNGIVKLYYLEGLSFREFLNYKTGENFQSLTFSRILNDHVNIAQSIVEKVKPLAYFSDYLRYGYYPYFLEKGDFYSETLLKNINLALEIDIPYINQIDLKYLPKLRKLLYIMASETPFSPNVSKLASTIHTSRATVMNYLQYLKDARLIHLLYNNGDEDQMKKPMKIYLNNTNLLHTIAPEKANSANLRQTFFINQVHVYNNVKSSTLGDFLVNDQYTFLIGGKKADPSNGQYIAADMIETGEGKKIPLWLFGFLY
jgi:predicted AAA+ superfamily ATPase